MALWECLLHFWISITRMSLRLWVALMQTLCQVDGAELPKSLWICTTSKEIRDNITKGTGWLAILKTERQRCLTREF